MSATQKVMTVFGTRPEAIKFAPVIHALTATPGLDVTNVISSQHTDLLRPFIELFDLEIHADLDVMRPNQQLNEILSRVVGKLDEVISRSDPDFVLVQGDTTTALAGMLAAFNRKVPVGHIEAGLRSGNLMSPFPEEMNRRLISQGAALHFAATEQNRANLRRDGISDAGIHVTGNPVVDALDFIRAQRQPSKAIRDLVADVSERKMMVLTTHRRENFGAAMRGYLEVLKRFVANSDAYALVFPVHPNPAVREASEAVFEDAPNIHLLDPLNYVDFVHLLSQAWLIVSDSGGIQEEAPSLGKALLVLRRDTERPEAIDAGVSRLVTRADALERELVEAAGASSWIHGVQAIGNPFGDGRAAGRIASCVEAFLNTSSDPSSEPKDT